jgi:hypothetical protein
LDLLPRAELVSLAAPCAQPIEASQFFLHSPAAPTRCAGAPLPGVYELGESLRWHSSGCHLRDLPATSSPAAASPKQAPSWRRPSPSCGSSAAGRFFSPISRSTSPGRPTPQTPSTRICS